MADTKISIDEIKKIAQLSKLDITGQEERFAELLSDTLTTIQILNELDTSNTSETYQVTGLNNVFQQNNPEAHPTTLSKEKALANAKENIRGLFATSAALDRQQ